MFDVRCTGCHRLETWDGDPPALTEVRIEGGARRPGPQAARLAWQALSAALDDANQTVFGACDACGQPRVTAARVATRSYDLVLTDVTLVVGDDVRGPSGVLDDPDAFVTPRLPAPGVEGTHSWIGSLFAGSFGVGMLAIWLMAMGMVAWFLVRGAQSGHLWQFR